MECKINSLVTLVPLPFELSGKCKNSFAYFTIKDRIPIIITKIVDYLCREKKFISKLYGKESSEEIKEVIGHLSLLKNNVQTNKLLNINSITPNALFNEDDTNIYIIAMENFRKKEGCYPKWFTASWMFAECYLYKRLHVIFYNTKYLNVFDPFEHLKQSSVLSSISNTVDLFKLPYIEFLSGISESAKSKHLLRNAVQVSMWGNQCDLCFSIEADPSENKDLLSSMTKLDQLLLNETDLFVNFIEQKPCKKIAVILDNCGFELIADLHFMTILMELKLCEAIDIYPKMRPWFVSDVMTKDLQWTMDYLRKSNSVECVHFVKLWEEYLKNEKWTIKERSFWTTPIVYPEMQHQDKNLYEELAQNDIIIFKGDLNYRKLVGDLNWPIETTLREALQGFEPSNLLILRTIKGGPAVGLDISNDLVKAAISNQHWNTSGDYGMIQFFKK